MVSLRCEVEGNFYFLIYTYLNYLKILVDYDNCIIKK